MKMRDEEEGEVRDRRVISGPQLSTETDSVVYKYMCVEAC